MWKRHARQVAHPPELAKRCFLSHQSSERSGKRPRASTDAWSNSHYNHTSYEYDMYTRIILAYMRVSVFYLTSPLCVYFHFLYTACTHQPSHEGVAESGGSGRSSARHGSSSHWDPYLAAMGGSHLPPGPPAAHPLGCWDEGINMDKSLVSYWKRQTKTEKKQQLKAESCNEKCIEVRGKKIAVVWRAFKHGWRCHQKHLKTPKPRCHQKAPPHPCDSPSW